MRGLYCFPTSVTPHHSMEEKLGGAMLVRTWDCTMQDLSSALLFCLSLPMLRIWTKASNNNEFISQAVTGACKA